MIKIAVTIFFIRTFFLHGLLYIRTYNVDFLEAETSRANQKS